MHACLFFNPAAAAGRSAPQLTAALAYLQSLNIDIELRKPGSADSVRAEIATLASHVERVVVLGSDGMIHQAANALVGTSTILGITPAGTGNDTARSLGLPQDIAAACRAAIAPATEMDVIESDAGIAVSVATAGFKVAVNELADGITRITGGIKYTLSALLEVPRLGTHPNVP